MLLRNFSLLAAVISVAAVPVEARADAAKEMAALSVFGEVNLSALKGDAKTERGPAMSEQRFQSVQSCWVQPGAPAQVAAAMRNFNPTKNPELKVLLHANGNNFSQLNHLPNSSAVDWLKNATEQKSNALQLSREEAAKTGSFAQFWSGILSGRASAGVFAGAPYSNTGSDVRPGSELKALLNDDAKVRKVFGGIVGGKGEQYWELIEADKKGVLTLGASFNRSAAGGAIQTADALYYASSGFYAGLTLYQLWPVKVDGRDSTLVWRGDYISSSELAGLRGVERLGSETVMLRDVARSIRAFRSDSGR